MAKSSGYFGLRRGSTKSHTFQVVGGVQITKDRVEGGKNPRTTLQMRQRMFCATISQAYKAMSEICNHAFEGVSDGRACAAKFRELNMKRIAMDAEYKNGQFGYNKWGVKGMMAGSYQLSDGTLPVPCDGEVAMESVNAVAKTGVITICNGLTEAELIQSLGVKAYGDIVTIVVAYPKANGAYGFGALRFTYKQGADFDDSFDFAALGDITGANFSVVTSGSLKTLKVTFATTFDWAQDATPANTYTAAIASQKRNGNWLRSEAYFNVDAATPSYDAAFATYPIGEQPFMNGDGSVQVGGVPSSESDSPSSPVVENPLLTIQKQGNGTSTITVAGSPMAASGQVAAGAAIAIDIVKANENDTTPYARLNGQSISLTLADGHYTGSTTMPSANATLLVDAGQTSGEGGMSQN